VLGVVFAFAFPDDRGDLVAWAEGAGPVRRNGRDVAQTLEGRSLGAQEIVALSYVASQLPASNALLVEPARFIAMPSIAYRLALAACGEAVAAVALNPLRAWDFAAGMRFCRGRGACFSMPVAKTWSMTLMATLAPRGALEAPLQLRRPWRVATGRQ
jgi:ADP-ribosyl-[dinitrogen reductase] hydrolase